MTGGLGEGGGGAYLNFRALTARLKEFRALKSFKLEGFRTLKSSNFEPFRALKSSNLEDFRVLSKKNIVKLETFP